jgi:hypothetical protein
VAKLCAAANLALPCTIRPSLRFFTRMKILQSVLRLTSFLVSAFALSNSVSVAELPPEVYQELKAKAPEQLTIKVLSADVTDFVNVVDSVTVVSNFQANTSVLKPK